MKLMTAELEKKFPLLYSTENKPQNEVYVIARFFDPCGSWTWFATEYDPIDKMFFGLVHGHEAEMGYFSLEQLEAYEGPFGLGIERDLHFGKHTLAEVLAEDA